MLARNGSLRELLSERKPRCGLARRHPRCAPPGYLDKQPLRHYRFCMNIIRRALDIDTDARLREMAML